MIWNPPQQAQQMPQQGQPQAQQQWQNPAANWQQTYQNSQWYQKPNQLMQQQQMPQQQMPQQFQMPQFSPQQINSFMNYMQNNPMPNFMADPRYQPIQREAAPVQQVVQQQAQPSKFIRNVRSPIANQRVGMMGVGIVDNALSGLMMMKNMSQDQRDNLWANAYLDAVESKGQEWADRAASNPQKNMMNANLARGRDFYNKYGKV